MSDNPIEKLMKEAGGFKYGTYGSVAYRDLDMARICLSSGMHDGCCQHCQQAVEKILKHYINDKIFNPDTQEVLKTHNLVKLSSYSGIECIRSYRDKLSTLKNYYYETRYPGIDYNIPSKDEAIEFYEFSVMFLQMVELEINK